MGGTETTTVPPMPTQQRFQVLDTYRFFAAFGVLVFHYSHPWAPPGLESIAPLTEFRLFVDFFFVLSGFVIMHTYGGRMGDAGDFARFIQKRLARVYPLHLLTLLAYAGLGLALLTVGYRFNQPDYLAPSAFVPNLLLVHAWGTTAHMSFNTPSWSISAEFLVYLAFPAFLLLVNRIGALPALAVAVLLAAGQDAARTALGMRHWTEATFDYGALRAVPTFLAGMALNRIVTGPLRHVGVPWWLAHACGAAVPALMLLHASPYAVIAMALVAVGALALAEMNGPRSALAAPAFTALGDASYAVYMLHPLVGTALVTMLPRVLKLDEAWRLPLTVVAAIVCVGMSIAVFRLVEDPARRALGRWPLSPAPKPAE